MQEMYNYYCYGILPRIFRYFTPVWIQPKDCSKLKFEELDYHLKYNPYVLKYFKGYNLAKDILDNGTYFPISIKVNSLSVEVREGKHRIDSLMKSTKGKDRWTLCTIYYDKEIWDYFYLRQFLTGKWKIQEVKTTLDLYNDVYYSMAEDFYGLKPEEVKPNPALNDMERFKEVYNLPILKLIKGYIVTEDGKVYNPKSFNFKEFLNKNAE